MVDILLAACNGEKYLPELIHSLVAQTKQEYRILWHDDGSEDGTCALLQSYSKNDDLFFCPSQKIMRSASGSFFELLQYSTSEYTMFCDQDDVWHPDKIEKTLSLMQSGETDYGKNTPLLVHTDLRVVDSTGNEIAGSFMNLQSLHPEKCGFSRLLCQSLITGCTVMINASLRKLVLQHSEADCLMHDWWISLLASSFGHILYLPEQTIDYRQHANNTVGAKNVSSLRYVIARLRNTKEIHESLFNTCYQAGELLRCYGNDLSSEKYAITADYAKIPTMKKWERICTIRRLNTVKCGIPRKIAQYIFI